MLARAHTFTIDGLQTRHVTVEVDVRRGLPAFTDRRPRRRGGARGARARSRGDPQLRLRVPGAADHGQPRPRRRAEGRRRARPRARVCRARRQRPGPARARSTATRCSASSRSTARVRASRGTLAVAQATRKAGLATLVLAGERAREAQLVDGLEVAVAERLRSAVRVLGGGAATPLRRGTPQASSVRRARRLGPERRARPAPRRSSARDRGGRRPQLPAQRPAGHGQDDARPATRLDPAAAEPTEAIEVTRIHSIAGATTGELARERPLRAPHHSITTAGLIGGAGRGCGRRGRARAQRRAVPRRALRVLARRRSRRCASHSRTAAWRSSGRGTRRSTRRASCCSRRPTHALADTPAWATGAAAAKPSSRVTGVA